MGLRPELSSFQIYTTPSNMFGIIHNSITCFYLIASSSLPSVFPALWKLRDPLANFTQTGRQGRGIKGMSFLHSWSEWNSRAFCEQRTAEWIHSWDSKESTYGTNSEESRLDCFCCSRDQLLIIELSKKKTLVSSPLFGLCYRDWNGSTYTDIWSNEKNPQQPFVERQSNTSCHVPILCHASISKKVSSYFFVFIPGIGLKGQQYLPTNPSWRLTL